MLRRTGVDNQNVAGAGLLEASEYGHQIRVRRNRDRSTDHAQAAPVRAEFPRQDAQRLVCVGEACRVELPDLRRNRGRAHLQPSVSGMITVPA